MSDDELVVEDDEGILHMARELRGRLFSTSAAISIMQVPWCGVIVPASRAATEGSPNCIQCILMVRVHAK